MAGTAGTANISAATPGVGCQGSSTDPSTMLNCTSGNTAVLASGMAAAPSPPTPLVNRFMEPAMKYKQDNMYMAKGGAVRDYSKGGWVRGYACGGVTNPIPTTGAPTQNSNPITAAQTCVALTNAGVPNASCSAGADAQIQNTMVNQAAGNGTLTPNETQTATLINANASGNNLGTCAAPTVGTPTANPATVGSTAVAGTPACVNAATYAATTVNKCTPQMTGAQGTVSCQSLEKCVPQINTNCAKYNVTAAQQGVDPNALVSNQIAQLTGCLKACQPAPAWAQPSINYTNAQMAARGLASSSIASGAEVSALQAAALPIACKNASYYANLDLANLSNRQQAVIANAQIQAQLSGANLTVAQQAAAANASAFLQTDLANLSNAQQADVLNQQSMVQTLLSDQAASNAAAQFNATSQNQVDEFMTNLASQVQLSNAAQINAMNQFNAGQLNSVSEFNANLANNVAQFNAANQLTIAQSNATWQRNVNTLNTAAINAANQTNAQNMFNLTTTAQANLWNQWQDQASWANTDAQNQLTRNQNMAIAALGQSTAFNLADQAQQTALLSLLGKFGIDVAGGPLATALGKAINGSGNSTGCSSANPDDGLTGCTTGTGGDANSSADSCDCLQGC